MSGNIVQFPLSGLLERNRNRVLANKLHFHGIASQGRIASLQVLGCPNGDVGLFFRVPSRISEAPGACSILHMYISQIFAPVRFKKRGGLPVGAASQANE